jgi:hypothetical protein
MAINKPFKDNLHKEWHLWMANRGAGQTAEDNLQCVKLKRLWDQISDEIYIEYLNESDSSLDNSDKESEDEIIEGVIKKRSRTKVIQK